MERVVILGPAGAGKSVLATMLGERTGLPLVHLDRLFWGPEWTPTPRAEALRRFDEAIGGDRWILDGNFLGDREPDPRFDRADTVIFLDLSRWSCLWRIFKRLLRGRGGSRSDVPEGATEGFDVPLLRWVWSYAQTDRPHVLAILARLDPRVRVHHLRSRSDVRRFVEAL